MATPMSSSQRTRYLLSPLLFGYLFSFTFFCAAQEQVYTFNFNRSSYYGEMYHLALGLMSDPNAFVHLPHISELPQSQRENRLKILEGQPAARQALLIYSFLKQLNLENRIISETTLLPPIGKKIFNLTGKNKPDGKGKFDSPVVAPLADTTQAFERFVDSKGDEAIKQATSLFTRSGNDPPESVKTFIDTQITAKQTSSKPFIIIWNRQDTSYQPERNMSRETMTSLISESLLKGYIPMILGPPIDPSWENVRQMISQGEIVDLTEIWKKEPFNHWETQVINQLDFFRELKIRGKLVGQIGMKGGAIDGPALAANLPTIELVIPQDTLNQAAKSRRIIRYANSIGNMMILQVDRAGSVRHLYNSSPADWLGLLLEPQRIRLNCRTLYQHLGLRVKM